MSGDPFKLVGTTLDDTVRIERVVGEGGFGVVYRAEHLSFGQPVAVKVLKLPGSMAGKERETFLNKFQLEARILYKLSQTTLNVVRPIHFGSCKTQSGLSPYCVMEWLSGQTLADALDARQQRIGAGQLSPGRPLGELVPILEPLVGALAAAHDMGVVHRDIKPPNVFLLGDGETPSGVKLLDFGIAKLLEDAGAQTLSSGTLLALTPEYAAPEQWDRAIGDIGPHTDIYALALMIVELMRDEHPHAKLSPSQRMFAACNVNRRPTPRTLGSQVNDAVEQCFVQALAVYPRDRARSVAAWWSSLRSALERGVATPATMIQGGGAVSAAAAGPTSATPAAEAPAPAPAPAPPSQTPSETSQPYVARKAATGWQGVREGKGSAPADQSTVDVRGRGGSGSTGGKTALLIAALVVFAGGSAVLIWALTRGTGGAEQTNGDAALATRAGRASSAGSALAAGSGGASVPPGHREAGASAVDAAVAPGADPCARYGSARACADAVEALYLKGQIARSLAMSKKSCAMGDALGCNELGVHVLAGKGVPKSATKAAALFSKACDKGEPDGCTNLSYLTAQGQGVRRDPARARTLQSQGLELSLSKCLAGKAAYCRRVGYHFQLGRGVRRDLRRAAHFFGKACLAGDAEGCRGLGFLYQQGKGVPRSHARARQLYSSACRGGDGIGCGNLALMFVRGLGGARDAKRARELFAKACKLGNAPACARAR